MDSLIVIQMAEWWVQAKEPQWEQHSDLSMDSSMVIRTAEWWVQAKEPQKEQQKEPQKVP